MLIVPKTQFLVNGMPMSRMRLPNGYGQISKIKNQRLRNPYRVRIAAARDPITRRPIRYTTIGYYHTMAEAQSALAQYHIKPFNTSKPMLLREVYEEWRRRTLAEQEIAERSFKQYESVYKHISLKDIYIGEIRPSNIRDNLTDPELPVYAPRLLLILYNFIFRYAVQEGYTDINIAQQVKLPKVSKVRAQEAKKPKSAFTPEELRKISELVGKNKAADVLFYSCLSGWRPSEVCSLSPESVNFAMRFVNGGLKTEAGKNRAVPIHPDAEEILRRYCRNKDMFGYKYKSYLEDFNMLMYDLGIEGHTPHDARRTFITLAKLSGMDEYALKMIVGHAISDLTESVYTDRPLEWLIDEMSKIPRISDYTARRAVL